MKGDCIEEATNSNFALNEALIYMIGANSKLNHRNHIHLITRNVMNLENLKGILINLPNQSPEAIQFGCYQLEAALRALKTVLVPSEKSALPFVRHAI